MSERLEEMLRIARAAVVSKLPPMHSEAHAQFENTFNPRTAEALVKRQIALERLLAAAEELLEVSDLRGDSDLPHPADDPKTWTARAAEAWDELRSALTAAMASEDRRSPTEGLSEAKPSEEDNSNVG